MIGTRLTRSDFACRCGCGLDTVDTELAYVINDLETTLGEKAHINSGCRCLKYNRTLKNSKDTSQHVKCRAADIWFDSFTPYTVYKLLDEKYPDRFGIGKYTSFTHIDTKSGPRRRW